MDGQNSILTGYSQNDNSSDKESLLNEINRLVIENKKLNRQLTLANNTMEKYRNATNAKTNLNAVITAEKSKQEKHIQVIIDNTPNLTFLFDSTSKLILTTKSFLNISGISSTFILKDKTFRDIFSQFSDEPWIEAMEGLIKKALSTNEAQAADKKIDIENSGNPRNYIINIIPFSYKKTANDGILIIFNDTTDIIDARDQAHAASQAKSDFLATMSHEIRTPLNAIIGMADMLEKTKLDEQQKMISNNMKNSSRVLLSLVNDILDFSKIEAGKFVLTESSFDIYKMIEHIKSVFDILFAQKGLEFHTKIDNKIPKVIIADENRMKQVITNLLSNSLKYTKEGHVLLDIFCPNDEYLQFNVEDTGIGIKEENLEKLFAPFEQFDRAANRNILGTGLGLAITNRLCELMKGQLTVRSTYGKGSVFSATFPIVRSNDSSSQHDEKTNHLHFTAPGASVLVVDDIEINLLIVQSMLEEYDMKVTTATSGYQAIELAKQTNFDIIFMDHMMPEIDGIITTQELRKLGASFENLPIIALTANATVEAQEMYLANKLNDFIAKPIDAELLNSCLHKWLPAEKIILANS